MSDAMQPKGPIAYLMLENAAEALALYEKAFAGTVMSRINYPDNDNKIIHSCIQIGGGPVFISDTNKAIGCDVASVSNFYLMVDDVDASFAKAKKAGLQEVAVLEDKYWGHRMGTLKDKFGITWSLATAKKEMSLDEIKKAAAESHTKAA